VVEEATKCGSICCRKRDPQLLSWMSRRDVRKLSTGRDAWQGAQHEDNQGCIFWIKNKQVSQRTKHVDIRVMFVREQHHKNKVTPVFCRSECNCSDGMTKNQPPALFLPHMKAIRTGDSLTVNSTCQREDVEERSSDDVQFRNQSSPA